MLAAQSVGEPCTQMVLRSFHTAGIESHLATKGLPRVVELLDAHRRIARPYTYVYLLDGFSKDRERIGRVREAISEVRVRDVALRIEESLSDWSVAVRLDPEAMRRERLDAKAVRKRVSGASGAVCYPAGGETLMLDFRPIPLDVRRMAMQVGDITVRGIPGAGGTAVPKEGELAFPEGHSIVCAGNALGEIFEIEGVDPYRTWTNDVFATLDVLGIEAARNLLVRELSATFQEQDLEVDPRHLELVADAMTRSGTVASVGRHGLGKDRSVFAKAAFEAPIRGITRAALRGMLNPMAGVVESTIIGKQMPLGTGSVRLRLAKGDTTYRRYHKRSAAILRHDLEQMEIQYARNNDIQERTSRALLNKGLGTAEPEIAAQARLIRKRKLHQYADNTERSFREALPSLEVGWGIWRMPPDAKVRASYIYRLLIKEGSQKGRNGQELAAAVNWHVCGEFGLVRNLGELAVAINSSEVKILRYIEIVGKAA
jgi:DNA-directed RNA polymerase beta' subunit